MQITYEDGTQFMLVDKKQALLGLDVSSSAVKLIELSRSGGRCTERRFLVGFGRQRCAIEFRVECP